MLKKAIGVVPRNSRTVDTVCSTYCNSLVVWIMRTDGCSELPRNADQKRKLRAISNIKKLAINAKIKLPKAKKLIMIVMLMTVKHCTISRPKLSAPPVDAYYQVPDYRRNNLNFFPWRSSPTRG